MVEYIRRGVVAVLLVNNPPVNALSRHVRRGLKEGLNKANNDRSVKSIVINGEKNFISGFDIKEFSNLFSNEPAPSLTELCDLIEASLKPVVSAINGYALGGGLEVAISSHYRLATVNTIFGFPEVDLGILPAATGTQRFPRLVGLETALDIIPSGVRFKADHALKMGVIDRIVSDNILKDALKFAEEISSVSLEGRRTSQRPVKDASKSKALHEKAVEKVAKKYPGLLAPVFCIKSVMAAVETDSFESGKQKELDYASVLFQSGQAAALQYAFFAQRKAVQWSLPDGSANYKTVKPLPLKSVGIIGLGTMGSGIAMATLNAGIPVILIEYDNQAVERGLTALRSLFEGSVKVGRLSREQAEQQFRQARGTLDYGELKDVDMVIEAVFERMSMKKKVFARLDRVCKPSAILCTNTSGLSVDRIAEATSRKGQVVGAHFFAPAYYMKLLEVIRGKCTSPEAIATVSAYGQRIGKIPVVVGNCNGFVGNRMMKYLKTESLFIVEEGSSVEEVDQTMEDFGFPMGPFKVTDLSGLDIAKSGIEELAKDLGYKLDPESRLFNGSRFSPLIVILANHGRLGRKTGSGWYDYEKPGAKVPFKSDYVEDLLSAFRRQHGIIPRKIASQEILERLLYALVNEGFKILEERIANTVEEIDTIFLNGFGWPRQTGGPMFYAKTVGLHNVYHKICHYGLQHPNSVHWQPSELLKKMATEETHSRI